MQASVHTFDPETLQGSVILDSGLVHPFGANVFTGSGLRHLRVGQRLTIEVEHDAAGGSERSDTELHLTRLWIIGIGEGERIT